MSRVRWTQRATQDLLDIGDFIAQDKPDAPPKSSNSGGGRVITISEVTIVGRVQKPIASVDVNKISPKLTLAELRQPFLDRIEAATKSDPF